MGRASRRWRRCSSAPSATRSTTTRTRCAPGRRRTTTCRAAWWRMPDKRGGRRKLNVTGCKHVYKGLNSKGSEFNIYEVQATTEGGQEIRDKLTAWVELPMGVREYDVTPYDKNGVFQSWTLAVPKE